ncbi:MAG: hypothetical protein ACOYCD_03920 [Kiritimatiellia bacterium]|jgi:hypothetical protein
MDKMKTQLSATTDSMSFNTLCKKSGKSGIYVRNLISQLSLPTDKGGFTQAYLSFIQKVISLRTFGVSMKDIVTLLEREKKLLYLLKLDAPATSPTWFLDNCHATGDLEQRLFLTGFNVGFSIEDRTIQTNFDFGKRDKELFSGREMGEDVRLALDAYLELVRDIKKQVKQEMPILRQALAWARSIAAV